MINNVTTVLSIRAGCNGVGIDAEEDVAEDVGLNDVELLQLLQAGHEGCALVVGIAVTELLAAIAQVVGNKVVGPQAVGGVDALVEQTGHGTVVVVGGEVVELLEVSPGDGLADGEVDAPLLLNDTREDAS